MSMPAENEKAASQNVGSLFCKVHTTKEVELYCEDCKMLICFHCILKGESHHNHSCLLIEKAYEASRAEIVESQSEVEMQAVSVNKALSCLNLHQTELEDKERQIKLEIDGTFMAHA